VITDPTSTFTSISAPEDESVSNPVISVSPSGGSVNANNRIDILIRLLTRAWLSLALVSSAIVIKMQLR
jgi:hypothetical protein